MPYSPIKLPSTARTVLRPAPQSGRFGERSVSRLRNREILNRKNDQRNQNRYDSTGLGRGPNRLESALSVSAPVRGRRGFDGTLPGRSLPPAVEPRVRRRESVRRRHRRAPAAVPRARCTDRAVENRLGTDAARAHPEYGGAG